MKAIITNISYSKAWSIGVKQEKIMREIMQMPDIKSVWKNDEIMQKINGLL